jgi:hypothetical protein
MSWDGVRAAQPLLHPSWELLPSCVSGRVPLMGRGWLSLPIKGHALLSRRDTQGKSSFSDPQIQAMIHLISSLRWRSGAAGNSSGVLPVRAPMWCRAVLLRLLLSVARFLGPLLRGVPLLLKLVLWTFPSALILTLVSPSTFRRFRLRRERRNWFSRTELLFAELSSHVDNLRAVSYSLPLSILLCFVQSASLVLGCDFNL